MSRSLRTDRAEMERWAEELARSPVREQPPTTVSGLPIEPLYTPDDLNGLDGESDDSAIPASTRSRAASTRACTAAGSGRCGSSPASARPDRPTSGSSSCWKRGRPASSTAFDLPTLMGLDSDDPRSLGEVGRLGVAVDTLDDMLELFDGIDLETISVSMTINAPAIVVMAFYLANAQDRGVDWRKLRGTHPERHPQGVPRPERVRLPAGAAACGWCAT